MKVLCGTDIIEVDRIKRIINDKYGKKFLEEIYTKSEIEYCESKGEKKYEHYAARFAAKEAVFKAISQEYTSGELSIKNIEIGNHKNGKPFAKVKNVDMENIELDISLSHIKEYATANCVAIVNKE